MLNAYQEFCSETSQVSLCAFGWRTFFQSVTCARKIRQALQSLKTEAVICSELHYIRMLALSTFGTRIKVLFHLGLLATAPMLSKRWAYRFIDCGVCPSEHTRESWIKDRWPKEKLHVIPNWVDSARFRPARCKISLRDELKLPCNKKILAYVGRLVPEKGIQTLLEAFSKLCHLRDDVLLVLIGKQSNGVACDWKGVASILGIDRHCQFIGQTDFPEKYMAASDIVVIPSEIVESFGLTVIEAMACGVIPLVSDVGILAQLVGAAAENHSFPAGDSNALLERLISVLELTDDMAADIGRQLRERVKNTFSPDGCISSYERLLMETQVFQ